MASVVIVVLATSVAGCGGETGSTATAPTTPSPGLQVQLSHLRARQIGLHGELCASNERYRVWDELQFDYTGVTEQQLDGANVSYRQGDGVKVAVGPSARELRRT